MNALRPLHTGASRDMGSPRITDGERILAVFIDFENLGLGFGNRRDRFNINRVLERLVEKGKIVAKKAYADWSRFTQYATALHSAAVELIEIPKRAQTGKNSADIRMCVDAMDLAYSKDHIDTFVVVSGDSDFSPLVSKLKELGKHVIGLGLADSTSELLRDNCDEFIYYEDLDRQHPQAIEQNSTIPEIKRKAFALLLDSLLALRRENKEIMYSSMVKMTMKRKKPSFNEEYHGYRTFSDLLEDAQHHGIIELARHPTSGTYIITRFGPPGQKQETLPITVQPARKIALPSKPPAKSEEPEQKSPPRSVPSRSGPSKRPTPAPPNEEEPRRTPPKRTTTPTKSRSENDERNFGRELIEDALLDDNDEIPSYGLQRRAKPAAKASTAPERPKPTTHEPKPKTQEKKPEKPPAREPKRSPQPQKDLPQDENQSDTDFGAGLNFD